MQRDSLLQKHTGDSLLQQQLADSSLPLQKLEGSALAIQKRVDDNLLLVQKFVDNSLPLQKVIKSGLLLSQKYSHKLTLQNLAEVILLPQKIGEDILELLKFVAKNSLRLEALSEDCWLLQKFWKVACWVRANLKKMTCCSGNLM